jgi:hypothetical protein
MFNFFFFFFFLIFLHVAISDHGCRMVSVMVMMLRHGLVADGVRGRKTVRFSGLVEQLFAIVFPMRRGDRRSQNARNHQSKDLNCSNSDRNHCQDEEAVVDVVFQHGFTSDRVRWRIRTTSAIGSKLRLSPAAALEIRFNLLLRGRRKSVPRLLRQLIHNGSAMNKRVHSQRNLRSDKQNQQEAVKVEQATRLLAAANAANQADEKNDAAAANHQNRDRTQIRQGRSEHSTVCGQNKSAQTNQKTASDQKQNIDENVQSFCNACAWKK